MGCFLKGSLDQTSVLCDYSRLLIFFHFKSDSRHECPLTCPKDHRTRLLYWTWFLLCASCVTSHSTNHLPKADTLFFVTLLVQISNHLANTAHHTERQNSSQAWVERARSGESQSYCKFSFLPLACVLKAI